ncbi:MAG: malate dehydrogenase [Candidatus Hydrothermarchaeales archaeon]
MKITIVGAGNIGAATAFLLSERKLCGQLALIDVVADKAAGLALDLLHCKAQHGVDIVGGTDYSLARDSDMVVITAGIPRMPGDSRLDLLKKNFGIMKGVIQNLVQYTNGIVLVVSNPVDVLTYIALKESGMAKEKVVGLGTMLDTLRLRSLLPESLGIDPSSAFVIGEHGDSMLPVSGAGDREALLKFFNEVRFSAAEVIRMRGYTALAPSMAIAEVAEAVVRDQGKVLPLSVYHEEYDLCIGALAKVGREGATMVNMKLTEEEERDFLKSVQVLKKALADLGYQA